MTPAAGAAPTPLLQVRDLCKHFPVLSKGLVKREVRLVKACDRVSFDLAAGETLGLVGESGSGKTTAGRSILRAYVPTRGKVLFTPDRETMDLATLPDQQLKPLRTRMQMIFQDPFSSLNPRMTVGEVVGEPLVIHRLARGKALRDRVADMLTKVGLRPEHQTRYPHAFSGGQRQRIGIARALIMEPALVIADEPVSALDVSVQAQVITLLQSLQRELNLTYLFIAHDLSVVRHISDRVGVMYAGRLVELAATSELFEHTLHPYSRALLSAVPNPNPEVKMSFRLTGEVPDPGRLPTGCSFHPRCPLATDRCRTEEPELRALGKGHLVSCHLAEEPTARSCKENA
jgi:oligopeptide/dipeptide ABC transporter ATP-binding protein